MDQKTYQKILKNVLAPYAEDHLPPNWIFQRDNDPKHKAKGITQWLKDNYIQVLDWPSQPPSLKPVENLWAMVQKEVRKQ